MAYVEHKADEVAKMLQLLGWQSTDESFSEIPASLQRAKPTQQDGLTEFALSQKFATDFAQQQQFTCMLGAGAYWHYIPEVVTRLSMRGEWLTSYTPYQAEASQGVLEVFFNFQSKLCNLLQMEVANLSVYDGATALNEAILMAVRHFKFKKQRILLPDNMHPNDLQVLETYLRPHAIELELLPVQDGVLLPPQKNYDDVAALVIVQPSFYGTIADVDALTNWAHEQGALVIGQVNPLAMALFKAPGSWGVKGADISCGEGQPLGISLSFGGPYFGFMATRKSLLRQLCGRLVGKTKDADGNDAYTLTLQTREQHIRRAKASSNICTNQGLMVIMATMHMAVLGAEGLRRQASLCYRNCHDMVAQLEQIDGVRRKYQQEYFHECVLEFTKPVLALQQYMQQHGVLFGYALDDSSLLLNVTEMSSAAEIARIVQLVQQWMEV